MVGDEIVANLPGRYTVEVSLTEIGFDFENVNTYRIVGTEINFHYNLQKPTTFVTPGLTRGLPI